MVCRPGNYTYEAIEYMRSGNISPTDDAVVQLHPHRSSQYKHDAVLLHRALNESEHTATFEKYQSLVSELQILD